MKLDDKKKARPQYIFGQKQTLIKQPLKPDENSKPKLRTKYDSLTEGKAI